MVAVLFPLTSTIIPAERYVHAMKWVSFERLLSRLMQTMGSLFFYRFRPRVT